MSAYTKFLDLHARPKTNPVVMLYTRTIRTLVNLYFGHRLSILQYQMLCEQLADAMWPGGTLESINEVRCAIYEAVIQ